MATVNPLLQTYDHSDHEQEMKTEGLHKGQAEAIAGGVEKVSNDTNNYYKAIHEIWQGHDRRLTSIDRRLNSIDKWINGLAIGGAVGFAATIALGVIGLFI